LCLIVTLTAVSTNTVCPKHNIFRELLLSQNKLNTSIWYKTQYFLFSFSIIIPGLKISVEKKRQKGIYNNAKVTKNGHTTYNIYTPNQLFILQMQNTQSKIHYKEKGFM